MEFTILDQPSCCKPNLPIAVIGSGPIGLAAAAHLQERMKQFVFGNLVEELCENGY